MRLSTLAVFLLACGTPSELLPSEAPLAARVLDPGCTGSPYTGVQQAIDDAVSGDTISICSGTWNETLWIDAKDLTLVSAAGAQSAIIDASFLGPALTITGGANVRVQALTFVNGSTSGTGGNISCEQSTLTLADSVVQAGSARDGGGLGAVDCSGTVTNTAFVGNQADDGGGAWIQGDTLEIAESTFTENFASDDGGGLYLAGSGTVRDTVFLRNESGGQGGGGYVDHGFGDIWQNTFARNVSGDDGGGLYVYYGAPTFEGNLCVGNFAAEDGGGVRFKLTEANVLDNTVVSNLAARNGGGVQITHDEVVMVGNEIRGNRAGRSGGGLFTRESASLFADNTFEQNRAARGGGMVVWEGWGDVDIEDSTFRDNTATDWGGHLFVNLVGHTTNLRRVTLGGGEAFGDGGAIYAVDSDLVLHNTLVRQNVAGGMGGGLYLAATTGAIANSVFAGGDALDGAALAVRAGVAFDVVNTAIVNHTGGAALHHISGTEPAVAYSDLHGNASDVSGMVSPVGVNGNLAVDPMFVAPWSLDYHLQAGSPLIDAGDPTIVDLDGTVSDIGVHGGPAPL